MLGEDAQKPRHQGELLDSGDVPDVALHDRFDVVQMPIPAAAPPDASQRLGVSAGEDGLHEVVADDGRRDMRRLAGKGPLKEGRADGAHLCLRQRKQPDDAHATGEGIGNTRERHEVGGSGEQESSRTRVAVDSGLDRQDEPRSPLDFVDDGPVEAAQEAHGVGRGGVEGSRIVERDEGHVRPCDLLRQGGLAGLPGAADQNDPGIRQRFADASFDETGVHQMALWVRPFER